MQEKGPSLRGNCYLLIVVAIKFYIYVTWPESETEWYKTGSTNLLPRNSRNVSEAVDGATSELKDDTHTIQIWSRSAQKCVRANNICTFRKESFSFSNEFPVRNRTYRLRYEIALSCFDVEKSNLSSQLKKPDVLACRSQPIISYRHSSSRLDAASANVWCCWTNWLAGWLADWRSATGVINECDTLDRNRLCTSDHQSSTTIDSDGWRMLKIQDRKMTEYWLVGPLCDTICDVRDLYGPDKNDLLSRDFQ